MTKEEACNDWLDAADDRIWYYQDLWNAACDWQQEQDATLVEDFVDTNSYYRAGQVIRNG